MAKVITDDDLELLDELGVEAEPARAGGRSAREQRVIAGFDEIERFVEEKGRMPEHGEDRDIFERLYATRLDAIRSSTECRAILKAGDARGLLQADNGVPFGRAGEEQSDEELLVALGVEVEAANGVTKLVHVRSRDEIKAAEEIAQRNPCLDFEQFRPIFEEARRDLKTGARLFLKYQDNAEVRNGSMFILGGQMVVVADLGEPFVSDYGRRDRRLRVVYDNGTESDLLLRSLQRALNKDKASRRVTEANQLPLFSDTGEENDLPTGYLYVLRSNSDDPFVAKNRSVLHKIGVTGGDVRTRVANAKKDPTYLLADVEIVAIFKLANINRTRLEALLHRFFGTARLDLELKDRFGFDVAPREWFLVPFPVIEEAVEMLKAGSISNYRYDPATAEVVPA